VRGGATVAGADNHMFNLSFDLPLREARRFRAHVLRAPPGPRRRQHDPCGGKTGLERTHLYRKLKQLGVEPGKLAKKGV
jgi:hypothetical protein